MSAPTYFGIRSGYIVREHDHRADDQSTKRDRRRKNLATEYDEQFVLSTEVAAILSNLPARVMADPTQTRVRATVYTTENGMREALTEIAQKLARVPAPEFAEMSASAVTSGSWGVALIDAARTLDGPLATALARGGTVANGEPYREYLLARVRAMDQAATNLAAALELAAVTDAVPAPTSERVAVNALRARHAAERHALADKHRAELQGLRHG
ncbi:hypothetical protein [Nocardia sp. XZ_19_231]|uniref:hypothetical protein n=1 Tax=Nocardia sp. XZ_19_231 TaxID=2769252 RepID=UPI001890668F|nr:hypothetical protein [Nocardia sp. XZ_19_231]